MSYYITESCIGCTRCAQNCPVDAIEGKLKERHVINKKRCVDCGVCGRVCPKGALIDEIGRTAKAVPKNQWLKPAVDNKICSACSMCVDICTNNFLKIADPKFRGDIKVNAYLASPDDCVGCGLCSEICPLNAISMEGCNK